MEPLTNIVADPSGTGSKYQESDDEEVFSAKEEMDEDIPPIDEEVKSSSPNTDKPDSSYAQDTDESAFDSSSPELKKYDNILPLTKRQLVKYLRKVSQVLFNRITKYQWEKHKEAAVSYADLRPSIEGYYEENVDHVYQTNNLVKATMNYLDKNSTKRADLLKALNGITDLLKALNGVTKTLKALNGLRSLDLFNKALTTKHIWNIITNKESLWNVGLRLTKIEHTQALMQADLSSIKTDTSKIKSMMTETFQAFKVQSSTPSSSMPQTTLAITEGPSHVRGRMSDRLTLKPPFYTKEEHVAMDDDTEKPESDKAEEEPKNAVPISAVKPTETPTPEDPDELIKVPYMINGKMYHLTNDEINAHMEKEDKIKKAAKEAKMCEMTKTEVIKVVQKEAEKIRLDYKIIFSVKVGEKFKKAQDVKHQVIKIEHSQKVKRLMDLNKKRVEAYHRFQEIHPTQKPAVLIDFKTRQKKLFGKRKKEEAHGLEPEIKVHGLECSRSLPEGVPFVNNMVIEEPDYGIFFTDVFGDQAFQRWNDIHKVRIDSLVSYLVMASMIMTLENARLRLKLKKLIAEHS
ncbi:hypothetical protein Tco_0436663 [Tanacetum coccineum]